jgi:molybdate transport system permease protein
LKQTVMRRTRAAAARDGALTATALVFGALFALFTCTALLALLLRVSPGNLGTTLRDPVVDQALWLSVRTSLLSAVLIVTFGTPLAAILATPFRGRAALETLVTLPVVLPPVVGGLALLLAFGRAGLLGRELDVLGVHLPFTTAAVIIAQTFVSAPLYISVAKNAFARTDPQLVEAAATLHASRAYTALRVIVPPAIPALAGGLTLAWARALGEFGATITFAGNLPGVTQTMPIAVYMAAQTDLQAAITIAVVLMVLSYGALLAVRHIAGDHSVVM